MSAGAAARRAILLAATLWAAITFNFALPRLAPGDPLDYLLGDDVAALSTDQRRAARDEFDLDDPVLIQYAEYLRDLASGDLGQSIRYGRPVGPLLAERAGWTLLLVLPAVVASFLAGTALGAVAAWHRGRAVATGLLVGTLFVDAMPAFWISMLLVAVFALELGWLPSFGALPPGGAHGFDAATEAGKRLIMPAAAIVLATVGQSFLVARAAITANLGEEYVRTAQAKGLPTRVVVFRHALRTSLLPIVTGFSVTLGAAAGGVVVVETVFSYPGLGRLTFDAVRARDYPLLQGTFLVLATTVILANWLAELTYQWLDPRLREDPQ